MLVTFAVGVTGKGSASQADESGVRSDGFAARLSILPQACNQIIAKAVPFE